MLDDSPGGEAVTVPVTVVVQVFGVVAGVTEGVVVSPPPGEGQAMSSSGRLCMGGRQEVNSNSIDPRRAAVIR